MSLRAASLAILLATGMLPIRPASADEPVLFSRHVVPVLSRLGCNAGTCHGAVNGKNGFRLSLFGAQPAQDHARLVREVFARRVDLVDPDASLLLRKPLQQIPHEGGKLLAAGSPEHRLLRAWIAAGAPLDPVEASRIESLEVTPASVELRVGGTQSLKVAARFADGSSEDVTALCTFESTWADSVQVSRDGLLTAAGPGGAAIVVRYRSEPVVANVTVPTGRRVDLPARDGDGFVDRLVDAKLRRLGVPPSATCDEATFLRRVSLDVAGTLPAPDEIRAFLADARPDKRAKKIDELLQRPGHAALCATRFCDLLRPTGFDAKHGLSENVETRRFWEWLRARLAENVAYDDLAARILTATGREGRPVEEWIAEVRRLAEEDAAGGPDLVAYADRRTLDLYWLRNDSSGVDATLQVAHAFLGLRMQCARCHRHPSDVWQQADLLDFANFFASVAGPGGKADPATTERLAKLEEESKTLKDELKVAGEKAKEKGLDADETQRRKDDVTRLTTKSKGLDLAVKRLKGTEVRRGETVFAKVSSPLGTQESRTHRLLGTRDAVVPEADRDPRELVAEWLRRPDNPFFAKALVNRVWAHYFGRGLVDPPDHLSPLNPPSHPELLDALAADFVAHKFDLRHLHRTLLSSRAYQRSASSTAENRHDTRNFAVFAVRRLPAEVLVDALDQATGARQTYPAALRLPPGVRAVEVAGATSAGNDVASVDYAFRIFGRPARRPEVQCDCEREAAPTMIQAIYLANHPRIHAALAADDGRIARIERDLPDEDRRIDELFLASVSRLPTETERSACRLHLRAAPTPRRGLEDVLWSLLNTREFVLNH